MSPGLPYSLLVLPMSLKDKIIFNGCLIMYYGTLVKPFSSLDGNPEPKLLNV